MKIGLKSGCVPSDRRPLDIVEIDICAFGTFPDNRAFAGNHKTYFSFVIFLFVKNVKSTKTDFKKGLESIGSDD